MNLPEATAVRITSNFSIDSLTFDKVPVGDPGPHEVLVAIKATSLNFRDYLTVIGKYNPNLQLPRTIGSDASGEVIRVGESVVDFRPGDRVVGTFFPDWTSGPYAYEVSQRTLGDSVDGVLSTARIFADRSLVHLPKHLSFEEGATLPCAALTAWHALVPTAHIQSGDTVLLLGTGGVSIFALQFAKMHGAHVLITSSSDKKLLRAKAMGADTIINYEKTPAWDTAVLELTSGRGADIVIETGGAGTLERSLKSVKAGGQVSLMGTLSGINEPLNIVPILRGNIRLQGIYVGSAQMFREMNRAIEVNGLKPVIDRVYPFQQTQDALRLMESGKHFGKIVITMES
jgi:NADPH:quinone reductase-like Zn-dependent oxidoreductase